MRDKTPLALMEQAVMILVFAIAAAVCIQAFAYCGVTSRRLERSGAAMTAAASVADAIKAGDRAMLDRLGLPAGSGQDIDHAGLDAMDGLPCRMYLSLRYGTPAGYFWTARLEITDEDGQVLAALDISGQKGVAES